MKRIFPSFHVFLFLYVRNFPRCFYLVTSQHHQENERREEYIRGEGELNDENGSIYSNSIVIIDDYRCEHK